MNIVSDAILHRIVISRLAQLSRGCAGHEQCELLCGHPDEVEARLLVTPSATRFPHCCRYLFCRLFAQMK
eukprot:5325295-Amphidinium_carterae.1